MLAKLLKLAGKTSIVTAQAEWFAGTFACDAAGGKPTWFVHVPGFAPAAGDAVQYTARGLADALQRAGKGARIAGDGVHTALGARVAWPTGTACEPVAVPSAGADAVTVAGTMLADFAGYVSEDATRADLCGVFLDLSGDVVATQGHRLRVRYGAMPARRFGVLLPGGALDCIGKRETVRIGAECAEFAGGALRVALRAPWCYPAWRRAIPTLDGRRALRGLPTLAKLPGKARGPLTVTGSADGWHVSAPELCDVRAPADGADGVRFGLDPKYYADAVDGIVWFEDERHPLYTVRADGVVTVTMLMCI